MPMAALSERAEFVDELAMAVQRGLRITQRKESQLVPPHAARQTIEQSRPEHLLDVVQHFRRRRLRHVHLLGRQTQITRRSQDAEELQMPEAQARDLRQHQGFTGSVVRTHERLEWMLAKK